MHTAFCAVNGSAKKTMAPKAEIAGEFRPPSRNNSGSSSASELQQQATSWSSWGENVVVHLTQAGIAGGGCVLLVRIAFPPRDSLDAFGASARHTPLLPVRLPLTPEAAA